MSISIKTAREIEKMRRAGELLEKVHDELGRAIHPGMSTWEINKLGEEMIRSFGCTPNSHGVTGGVYKARERIHRGMLIRDY